MEPHNSDDTWLYGYGVSGLGGISGDAPVRVGPLTKVNFLVGRNNHGKSTLLRAASAWVGGQRSTRQTASRQETLVPVLRQELVAALRGIGAQTVQARADAIATFEALDAEYVGVWVERQRDSNTTPMIETNALWRAVKDQLQLGNYSINRAFSIPPHTAARAVTIPAFRELREAAAEPTGDRPSRRVPDLASGEGLVAELSTWERPQNPGTSEYDAAKERWARLRLFMQDVLEDPEAELEVANRTDLHVRLAQAGSMLHINSLGDGIKQVLMIGAACIYFDDHLVLLEEPEIHLHAGLQRKLIRFLAEGTASQYIIATHSAHVLDLPGARIFHVTHDGSSSRVTSAVRASEVHRVSQDLGYMASDLLQANYTLWVEGPSDRIYWRKWLGLVDEELEEGVHYAVMTYGGYLVDGLHLRDEEDVESDLIALLRVSRNCTLITDSDKPAPDAPLRPTAVRLLDESKQEGSGDVLICDWASTVENLLPRDKIRQAAIRLHPVAGLRLRTSSAHTEFDDPFHGMGKSTFSKVKIAREVCDELREPDLDARLLDAARTLADRIREANGMPAGARPTRG